MFPRKFIELCAGGCALGTHTPQYCSMKQRLRGQQGFQLDVCVACTLLFLLLTVNSGVTAREQLGCSGLSLAQGERACAPQSSQREGEVVEVVCVSYWSEGTKCVVCLFCIFCLSDRSITTDLL